MKTKLIEIPKENDERKFTYFPQVSTEIMKEFYSSRKAKGLDTDTAIKSKDYAAYTFAHTRLDHSIDFCKCKLRIEMPKENTFIIDTDYVKRLKKVVDARAKQYRDTTRGVLIFPVINERKIYMINIDKLDSTYVDSQFVNNTYKETNVKREGEYYYIPKENMIVVKMPETIQFYSNEKQFEKIIEKKVEERASSLF